MCDTCDGVGIPLLSFLILWNVKYEFAIFFSSQYFFILIISMKLEMKKKKGYYICAVYLEGSLAKNDIALIKKCILPSHSTTANFL